MNKHDNTTIFGALGISKNRADFLNEWLQKKLVVGIYENDILMDIDKESEFSSIEKVFLASIIGKFVEIERAKRIQNT